MKPKFHRAFALLALTLAASCSAVSRPDPSFAAPFDPLTAEPENIAVAIGVPESFQLRSGDARLSLSFAGGGAANVTRLEETVALDILPGVRGGPKGDKGEQVYVLQIAAGDLGRLERAQAEILKLKAGGGDGLGSISVEVSGGCFTGPVPATLPVSSWLRTDPLQGFVRLSRSEDAFAAFDPGMAATLRGNFTQC